MSEALFLLPPIVPKHGRWVVGLGRGLFEPEERDARMSFEGFGEPQPQKTNISPASKKDVSPASCPKNCFPRLQECPNKSAGLGRGLFEPEEREARVSFEAFGEPQLGTTASEKPFEFFGEPCPTKKKRFS